MGYPNNRRKGASLITTIAIILLAIGSTLLGYLLRIYKVVALNSPKK